MTTGLIATPSQTIGPFFHVMPTCAEGIGRLAAMDTPGERLTLRVRVVDVAGAPVPDALIELRQADADGLYATEAFPGFGRLGTNDGGWCEFETIRPGPVQEPGQPAQAPHINVCVFARGLLRHLYTRVYFAGDALLDGDPLLAVVPAGRRATLFAVPAGGGVWEFVIRLQGDGETVFFDL